jgi:hypothetical protein
MKKIFFLGVGLWLAAGLVIAEERASESDMFGGTPSKTKAPAASKTPLTSGEEQSSPDLNPTPSPKTTLEENFQIGGTLSSEADFYIQNGVPLAQNTASNPNILFLYLDSKLENDSRVFARIRTFFDPTGVSGGTPNFASLTNPYGFGTGTNENLSTSLQELRISTNISHQVFFTIGRQKVKYGAAKFFNPTDFLNSQPFNFFLPSDERPGVDMVKMQIPSGTNNLYAVGLSGNPSSGNPAGGYFRDELGYDGVGNWLGSGEISLSGFLPKNQPGRAGFDLSQEVGDFDVYFEGAAGQDAGGDWKDALSTGASWQVRYADRETNTVTFEGEYFQAGALSEYGIFAILLAGPGSLTDITFVETNLFDFNGQSGLSRLDTICQFSDRVSGRVYVSGSWGNLGGAFYLPNQLAQTGMRMDVNF